MICFRCKTITGGGARTLTGALIYSMHRGASPRPCVRLPNWEGGTLWGNKPARRQYSHLGCLWGTRATRSGAFAPQPCTAHTLHTLHTAVHRSRPLSSNERAYVSSYCSCYLSYGYPMYEGPPAGTVAVLGAGSSREVGGRAALLESWGSGCLAFQRVVHVRVPAG